MLRVASFARGRFADAGSDDGTLKAAIADFAASTSFETSARDLAGLEKARGILPPGSEIFVSWMPDDTDEDRVAAARFIRDSGWVAIPHIAARRVSSAEAGRRLVERLHVEAGVDRLFLIGGDIAESCGPFSSARELFNGLEPNRFGIREVGFAGHPEGHPAVEDSVLESELDAKLTAAVKAGLDVFVATQFVFDAEPVIAWLQAFRARVPAVPVRIGLAGPASIRTLLRYAQVCGVGTSAKALVSHGASVARMLTESGPDPIIRGLATAGVAERWGPVSLHVFPFGGLGRSARWIGQVAEGRIILTRSASGFRVAD